VRHLFVTTGIRVDPALAPEPLVRALALCHTSGHLKVAPEHVVPRVLGHMRKPAGREFLHFLRRHRQLSTSAGRRQHVLPYLMAAHPGCTLADMVELALFLAEHHLRVEQGQIFTPTPGTPSTAMYASGLAVATLEPVHVTRDDHEKQLQKALILYHHKENRELVREALAKCHRRDLEGALLGGTTKTRRQAPRPKSRRRS